MMEVDPPSVSFNSSSSDSASGIPINFWCFLGKDGSKRVQAVVDIEKLPTLDSLKEFVCKTVGSMSPNEIDILYNGGKLKDDEALKKASFRPMNVLTVIKTSTQCEQKIDVAAAASKITQVASISTHLRNAFLNPKFMPTILKMGQSGLLEQIIELVPAIKNDAVGIGMIQDPILLFHLSDYETLSKLIDTKPWVVEAIKFIPSYTMEQATKGSRQTGSGSGYFNPSLLADDDEDMEDDDDDELGASGSNSRITREQLSAALNSLSALGRGPFASPSSTTVQPPSATGSSLFDLFSQAGGPRAHASSGGVNPNPNAQDLARLLSSLQSASSGGRNNPPAPPRELTPDLVARAMNTALNSLPAGSREAGFSELRDRIARIQNMGSSSTNNPNNTRAPPAATVAQPTAPTNAPYSQQLNSMRAMGVNDERLSLLALRVSDGDVSTAVELILSGWTGEGSEGADEEMPDEE